MIPENLKESLKKLDLKKEQWQLNIEIVLVVCILYQIYSIFIFWDRLPDEIPIHFDFQGKPDGYGGKSTLLIFPIVSAFLYILMSLINRFPQIINAPWKLTEENLERQMKLFFAFFMVLKSELVLMMTIFCYQSIEIALGNAQTLGNSPLLLVSAMFATIAWYILKGYSLR